MTKPTPITAVVVTQSAYHSRMGVFSPSARRALSGVRQIADKGQSRFSLEPRAGAFALIRRSNMSGLSYTVIQLKMFSAWPRSVHNVAYRYRTGCPSLQDESHSFSNAEPAALLSRAEDMHHFFLFYNYSTVELDHYPHKAKSFLALALLYTCCVPPSGTSYRPPRAGWTIPCSEL